MINTAFQWQGNINRASEQFRGLVGWWPHQQQFGGQLREVLNGQHAVLYNGAAIAPSSAGLSLSLDGSNDYGTVPQNNTLWNVPYITLNHWIINREPITGAFKPIFLKPYTSHATPHYQYGITISGNAPVINMTISGTMRQFSFGNVLPYGTTNHDWSMLTATYDGTTMRSYMNGQPLATASYTGTITGYSTPISVGAHHWLTKSSTYCFRGVIGDSRIYNRPLSPGEIRNLYKNRYELYQPPRPMVWWIPPATTNIIPRVRHHMAQQGMA